MFRALWQRIARLFGGGKEEGHRAPGGIPAPETLVAKVQNVRNKDRDIIRVAGEALRRGHPDQAVIAYWKAVQVYLHDGQLLKAISALKMILQHAPDDLDAFHALADAYEALDRKRDAANTCLWIADVFARRGQHADALAILYRSLDLDPQVKGARERIQALGGDLPASARPASMMGPQLRLQSKQEAPARAPTQAPPPPRAPTQAPPPPRAPTQAPPIVGIPLAQKADSLFDSEDDNPEMPGDPVVDDDKLELDIEGDDALDFPDDSLVLPVTEAKRMPEEEDGVGTIAMAAIETDPAGTSTIAMQALDHDAEMMSEDLGGDVTMLAMEAPPWEGPTDEYAARQFEDVTEPPTAMPPRKFGIPAASTTVDLNPPSAMQGSEHDPKAAPPGPRVGIPGDSTRAYSVDDLKKLGIKPPPDE